MQLIKVITVLEISRCGHLYFLNKIVNGCEIFFAKPVTAEEAAQTYEQHRAQPIQRTIGIINFEPPPDGVPTPVGQEITYWSWRVQLEESCETC